MQLNTSSKAARRLIADEFKERKVPRGIFAIRCGRTAEAWVGSSPNLDSAKNSLWFQLRGGLVRHQSLQQAWNRHGADAFEFAVLERLDDGTPELLLHDLLSKQKKIWASSLNAFAL